MSKYDRDQLLQSKIKAYQQQQQNVLQQNIKNQFTNYIHQHQQQDQHGFSYIRNQIKCKYNKNPQHQACLFLCCTKDCIKYPAICGQQCTCEKEHFGCTIILAKNLLSRLNKKIQRQPPKSFQLYIQGKISLLNYMMDRISLEQRIFQKWIRILKKRSEQSEPFYLFQNKYGYCEHLRVGIGKKELQKHKYCSCNKIELKFRPKGKANNFKNESQLQAQQQQEQQQLRQQIYLERLKALYNERCKKYNQIFDVFGYKIQEISQLEAKSYFMNYAQFQVCKYFLQADGLILFNKSNQNQIPLNGNIIFLANQLKQLNIYNQKDFSYMSNKQHLFKAVTYYNSNILLSYSPHYEKQDIYYPTLKNLRNKWKSFGEKVFRKQFEGKALSYDSDYFQVWQLDFQNVKAKQMEQFSKNLQKIFNYFGDQTYFMDSKMKKIAFVYNQNLKKKIKSKKNIKQISSLTQKLKMKQIQSYYRFLNKKSFDILKKISSLCLNISNIAHFHYARYCLDNFKHKIRKNNKQQQQIQTLIQNEEFKRNCFPYLKQAQDFCQCLQQNQYFFQCYNQEQERNIPINEQRKAYDNFKEKLKKESTRVQNNTIVSSFLNPDIFNCCLKKSISLKFISQFKKKIYVESFSLILKDQKTNEDKINDLILEMLENNPKISEVKISGYQWKTTLFDSCIVDNFKNTHLCKISKLFIQDINTKFSILFLKGLKNLKVLSLKNCQNQNRIQMEKTIKHLTQIQQLSFVLSITWITDQILQGLNKLTQLKSLNLTKTKITSEGIKKLPTLKNLKTFICEFNPNIYRQDILDLFKNNPQISKISVQSLSWKKRFINEHFYFGLNKNSLNGLTHINLKHNQHYYGYNSEVLEFKSIKYLINVQKYRYERDNNILLQKGIIVQYQ